MTSEERATRDAKVQVEQERARVAEQEASSEATVKQIAKICPNTACGARIQKEGGCDHMNVSFSHFTFQALHHIASVSGK